MFVAFSYLQLSPLARAMLCYQGEPQTSTEDYGLSYNYLSDESDLAYYTKVERN